jgi:general stress protein YciG
MTEDAGGEGKPRKKRKGFACMDRERVRAIARKGGEAAQAKGTAHRFTSEEAAEAGRKGGVAAHGRGKAHRFTSEEASKAAKKRKRKEFTDGHGEAGTDQGDRHQGPDQAG